MLGRALLLGLLGPAHILAVVERTASVLSSLGIIAIIGTFSFSRQFRNPIHRLIFINAFYSIFDVTATFISLSGPDAGNHSALCQFQGFLMQMFPLADVLWTLAMALDVFLIVYYKYDSRDLRKLEPFYIVTITSLVGIPAGTFLFIHTAAKGPMYASVTLWCSISPNWVLFRIVFFYGPIWLIIFGIMMLYALVGIEIIKQRRILKNLVNDYVTLDTMRTTNSASSNHFVNAVIQRPEPAEINANSQLHSAHLEALQDRKTTPFFSIAKSSTSSSNIHPPPPSSSGDDDDRIIASEYARPPPSSNTHTVPTRSPLSFRQYILMPLMFFVILLAVWVAPTTNRVTTFINPKFSSYPLLLAVGTTGSLRGFWNGVVFITLGMKERKRQKELKRTRRQVYVVMG